LAESIPGLLSLGCGSCHVFGAIQTERPVPERNIEELAVVGLLHIRVRMRAEMLAGHAHPRDWNFSLQLERPDEFHQRRQKPDLFLC
jgi:hypothetical protein